MRVSPEKAASRREFFRGVARYILLTVLGAAAALATRRRLSGQQCVNQGICSGCRVFASCGLPQALSAKRVQRGA